MTELNKDLILIKKSKRREIKKELQTQFFRYIFIH